MILWELRADVLMVAVVCLLLGNAAGTPIWCAWRAKRAASEKTAREG
jgi:hypothetical protein